MAEENKMGAKPMLPLILSMAVPPLCSMFLQYTYNFVDCIFVSWLSEDALTAVSLSFPMTTLMVAMSIWIGVGTNVLIARYLGKKEQDTADNVVSHGIILAAACGAAVTILLLLILKPYFSAFTDDKAIYDLCIDYMFICAFMQLPNMVHIAIQKIIQGTGNMLAPMWFQIAGVVLNFILDPLLIFGIGPFPELGIRGAAISTLLGYTLSMALAFYVILFRKQKVRIKTKGLVVDFGIFKEIFSIGLPSFIMNALGAFMITFANLFLIAYSTTAVAFFGAYFKAQQMVVMTVNGLIQGCIPVMSYNYGAKDKDRLQLAFRYGTIIAIIMMAAGGAVLSVFPAQVLKIFMASDAMLEFGIPALRIMATSYIFNGIATMAASYMQSTGRVKYSVVINLLRQLIVLIPLMYLFTRFIGMTGVWAAFPIAEIVTCMACWYLYKKHPVAL